MKSLLKMSALLLLLTAPVYAQDAAEAHHEGGRGGFGIQGGANFNNFNYTNNTVNQAKQNTTGWLAGVHFEGWEMDMFAIRLEADYSVKGFQVGNIATVKYNYLEVPLLLKFTPLQGPVKVFIEGGGSASIKLSTSVTSLDTTTTFTDNSNTWNFALIAGAGLGFMVGPNMLLSVEGRYNWGLTNISNNTYTINTRDLQAIAGLTFLTP